jgi:L-lactate dehydrogenase complex protein LldF
VATVRTREFRQASLRALSDARIQAALQRVMGHFDEARRQAIEELTPEVWEGLGRQAREIKQHTLENLDYYLGLLAERVARAGGVVHFARDSQEARHIVTGLALERGVRLVTKGKSMVSEEMGINRALE